MTHWSFADKSGYVNRTDTYHMFLSGRGDGAWEKGSGYYYPSQAKDVSVPSRDWECAVTTGRLDYDLQAEQPTATLVIPKQCFPDSPQLAIGSGPAIALR